MGPEGFLKMPELHPRPNESDFLGVGPGIMIFYKCSNMKPGLSLT